MPKYFLTCVLLSLLAMENNNVYSRIFIWTSASEEANPAHYMRHHRQLLQHRTQQQQHHQQHHHKRSHRHEHHEQHVDSDEDEDVEFAQQRYELLQRHLSRQREHQQHHQQHYQQSQQSSSAVGQQSFGAMPRIWQHLKNSDEHMLSDASESNEFISRTLLESVPPLVAIEGSNIDGGSNDVDSFDRSSSENESAEMSHKRTPQTLRCPKCETHRKVEHITEEELTRLRIEFVKQQILEKLRLKERPNVSAIGLPKPIYEGTTIQHEDEQTKTKDLDDYYARTSKKFIFLERETYECQRLGPHPSICFSFKIDDADADGFDVNTAVLWIFKNKQINNTLHRNSMKAQQTIVVSEVQQQLDSKYLPKVKPIAIQSIDVQGEWMKIDIEWPIKSWFGNHDLSHLIHISCQSCEINSMDEMISVDKDYRPFIMIDTQNRRRVSRQKRSVNCTDGVTECCREKLYISFDDIGWGDWIIQPRGYDAYFCRGKCGSLASVTQISSPHSSFLQKVISSNKYNGKPLELIPCCTAKQYSSLQLVFMDSNNTATLKTFPNMVVESCGCR